MNHAGRWAAGAVLLLFCTLAAGHGQETYKLNRSALQTMRILSGNRSNVPRLKTNKVALTGAIDSIVTFSGSYKTHGYGPTGKSQRTWYYEMAGRSPDANATTAFKAPIIPVSVELLSATGGQAYDNGHLLYADATQYVLPGVNSPLFQNALYSGSKQPTQFTDAVMRAEFDYAIKDGWHTLLTPVVEPNVVLKVPYGSYYFALNTDGSCCAFILIDSSTFSNLFLPSGPADSSTIVGSAEASGGIATTEISTFLFPSTYLYSGNPQNCCILGFHTADSQPGTATNGDLPREYVLNYSSWISPGSFGTGGPQDITALSHELAETFNDPFAAEDGIHGITPWWLSPNGTCEDDLEVGDAIEGLPNSTYPVSMNRYVYHPQNEALLEWFEFERHSKAIGRAYSYPGTSALTALSP